MKHGRWFLPEMPDLNGLLRGQIAVTIEGADALARGRRAIRRRRSCFAMPSIAGTWRSATC